ncbi:class I SAM-dependent methyltransferase [Labrys okinawensis]|uniref:Class I SAM-dependent methyltransferase n=2 Tax=Labrys okinawensis TaxID=346911 RepID=A0A2S9Q3H5_9HYPH|nr:class I SAM-dependent methyltransferase [Labrys okinawensis]
MLSKWLGKLRRRSVPAPLSAQKSPRIFDRYVISMPTHQNAVDVIQGWTSAFPPEFGIKAGALATYLDPRIAWMMNQYGPLEGKVVLELGPLEGGHTVMLERAGAIVDAIEANQSAFLRCLITKEIFGLSRSRIWLGDFVRWLEGTEKTYDLIVASGVLYHANDPLHLIDLIAKRTDAVYFWTHFMDDEFMPPSDPRRAVFADKPQIQDFHGVAVRTYLRTYRGAANHAEFCGGPMDQHRWLHRDDMLAALRAVGFSHITLEDVDPDHRYGPAMSIYARK